VPRERLDWNKNSGGVVPAVASPRIQRTSDCLPTSRRPNTADVEDSYVNPSSSSNDAAFNSIAQHIIQQPKLPVPFLTIIDINNSQPNILNDTR
jgi:hypothetical protein